VNKEFESEVNDFGDSYHQYDDDLQIVDKDTLKALKSIKRRYRDFDEWCDAIQLFNSYVGDLVDKYGGKKRFKLYYQLNMVKEYIPVYPTLRRIKTNMPYIKKNLPRPTETVDYHCKRYVVTQQPAYTYKVDFCMKEDPETAKELDKMTNKLDRRRVSEDIARIQNYYNRKVKHPVKMSKKALKRRMKKKLQAADDYVPIKEALKKYYECKSLGTTLEEHDSEEAVMYYKGAVIKVEEYDEVATYDALRAIGIRLDKTALGKRARKVVLKRKKKQKKLEKVDKKRKKLSKKYMKEFTDGEYETFEDFQNSMRMLVAKQIRGEA
jgi:hypothetical protein